MDVKQAAEILDISSEGIRQRIRRGTLESEKDTDGRVYVFIADEDLHDAPYERDTDGVVTRLENEVDFLRKELATRDAEIQRRDAILLSLSEGLKSLNPPPPEPRESDVSASQERDGVEVLPEQEKPVSWWRRLFG